MSPERSGPDEIDADYRVAVRSSAVAASSAVAELVAEWGRTATFPDRPTAERVATDLADRGTGTVWIQSAPADAGVDAYLVGRERVPWEPVERDGDEFACRVSADQYGALGETLVTTGGIDPALRAYVREDLPITGDVLEDVVFETDPSPPPVFADPVPGERAGEDPSDRAGRRRWVPDCRIRPRLPGEDRAIRTYWCEVKTGDGDPERSQLAAMRARAREATVLLVSVDVEGLPERYEVSIDRVDPQA